MIPDWLIDNMYDMEKRGKEPIFEFLCRCIRDDIINGRIKGGDKLPSKRNMAQLCGVSLTSVQSAYNQLECEGYIYSLERKGWFAEKIVPPVGVKEAAAAAYCDSDEKNIYKSGGEAQSGIFPISVWSRLMRATLSENYGKLTERMPQGGVFELRLAIADYLRRNMGLSVKSEQIIIGAGSEYLISLIVALLGRTKIYALEDPGYPKISKLYTANGVSARYMETDKHGIITDTISSTGASVLHISPANHYPVGGVMPVSRRYELLSWVMKSPERYIVEDDYDSEIFLSGSRIRPLAAIDKSGRVIYMNTFTKTISPSFRVGYIVLPEMLLEKFKSDFSFLSCTVSSTEQYTLAKFISGQYFERNLSRMRTSYRRKRDNVLKALDSLPSGTICYDKTSCGTNVILTLQNKVPGEYIAKAINDCPSLTPLDIYIQSDKKKSGKLILDFSFINDKDERYIEALQRIADYKKSD